MHLEAHCKGNLTLFCFTLLFSWEIMLQLDGNEDCFWEQFFSIKLDANPHRRELYHSFLDKARAALEHAFSLARYKEKFHIWSMAASSVVDIQVLLVAMEMAWNREDHPKIGDTRN